MIDSNPAKVFEQQNGFDDMVYHAVNEIGNHYFDTYVFDCQAKNSILKEEVD